MGLVDTGVAIGDLDATLKLQSRTAPSIKLSLEMMVIIPTNRIQK